jgi:hypothetical protein
MSAIAKASACDKSTARQTDEAPRHSPSQPGRRRVACLADLSAIASATADAQRAKAGRAMRSSEGAKYGAQGGTRRPAGRTSGD